MTQGERVALVTRYLTALRDSEQAERRFFEAQVWVFGASAVMTVDALSDLVEAGFVSWGTTNPNLGKSPGDPPVLDADREMVQALGDQAARAQDALHEALVAIRAALERDGAPFAESLDVGELEAWAGIGMDGLGRVIRLSEQRVAATDSNVGETVVGSSKSKTYG